MGVLRGTLLGLTGVLGVLVERTFGLVSRALLEYAGIGPVPEPVGFLAACFVGVVAGDLAANLTGQNVRLGMIAGIKKGLIASFVAGTGLYLRQTGATTELLGPMMADVGVLSPEQAMLVGSIWVGAVLGDLLAA